jgi:cell division protein FtsN
VKKNNKKPLPPKKASPPPKRKGYALWICLIFFISGWMFLLGIFVGRGSAPVHFDIQELQKELADLKEVVLKKEKKRFKIDPDVPNKSPDLAFYEALKQSRTNTGTDDHLHGKIPAKKGKSIPEKAVKTKSIQKKKKASGIKKAKADKRYTIQVAALKDASVADEMISQLKKKGYPAYRVFIQLPDKGIWYRIRVGFFNNPDEARNTLNRLKKEGFKAIVVKK